MSGDGEKKDKPGSSADRDSLPPMVFDPGEVTATYPVGALTQQISEVGESAPPQWESGPHEVTETPPPRTPQDSIGEQLDALRKRQAQPRPTPADTASPLPPEKRSGSRKAPTLSPALLFALSLVAGGGLALLLVLVGLILMQGLR